MPDASLTTKIMKTSPITTLLSFLAITTTLHAQGPLNPPAGPIAPVMRSLSQIEPRIPLSATTTPGDASSIFIISSPGSYYLTGNLPLAAGYRGIAVACDDVTIDLAGFSIEGVAGSHSAIGCLNAACKRLVVKNGGIRGPGSHGINNSPPAGFSPIAYDNVFENLTITGCKGYGIHASNGMVRNCVISECTYKGIILTGVVASVVESCTVNNNAGGGISINNGIVSRCSAVKNPGTGVSIGNSGIVRDCHVEGSTTGINGANLTVTGCAVYDCTTGISSNIASLITGNNILSETLAAGSLGIYCGYSGTRLEHNNVVNMATGMKIVAGGNLIIGNSFRGNTTALNAAAGNRVGTLLTGTSSAAINGNSGGGLGTADPAANVIY